jgi:hypothetical protein
MGEIAFLQMDTASALAFCSKKMLFARTDNVPIAEFFFEGRATPSPVPRNTFVETGHCLTQP